MNWLIDHLAVVMFFALIFIMFLGYPVAFLLGAIGIGFGFLGIAADVFSMNQFANLLPRIYGQAMQNPVLVAIPMFIFMGTMLEKSGVAEDLLHALQLMLRRVPGGLAIAVTILGTIMAATTGIVGASVIMLTLIALPVMLDKGYDKTLAVGTIASAGTLGILIPPSIMLVIMGDLLRHPGRHAVHRRDPARPAAERALRRSTSSCWCVAQAGARAPLLRRADSRRRRAS